MPAELSVLTKLTSVSVPGISYTDGYPLIVAIADHLVGCSPYSKSASSILNGGATRIRSIASVPNSYGRTTNSSVSTNICNSSVGKAVDVL